MPEERTGGLAVLMRNPLLWPVLALAALLVVNVVATPTFFEIRMQDGHLYGNLVDVLRNGAPIILVALVPRLMRRWERKTAQEVGALDQFLDGDLETFAGAGGGNCGRLDDVVGDVPR